MVEIREGRIGDIEAIIDLLTKLADHEKLVYDPVETKDRLSHFMFGENPRLFSLVAVVDGGVVGLATYSVEFSILAADNYLRLNTLYVLPEHRNKGLGKEMMDQVFNVAKKSGIKSVQWFTPDFNDEGINFYKSLGAKTKSMVRFYMTLSENEK